MAGAARRSAAAIGLTAAGLALASCSAGSASPAKTTRDSYGMPPQHILAAPKSMLAATGPQANGAMWALTSPDRASLFEISAATGQVETGFSVSDFARSVAESPAGIIGLALATGRSGALQLVNAATRKATRVVRFPWPAVQVAVARGTSTFYVLTARAGVARVIIVAGQDGRVTGQVAVPSDVVAVVPGVRQASLYAMERDGLLDQIAVRTGKLLAKIRAGSGGAESVTLSPDGRTVYVLERLGGLANIALVDPVAQVVRKVLAAPGTCVQVLVSPDGGRLYEVVRGTRSGSIQITPAA